MWSPTEKVSDIVFRQILSTTPPTGKRSVGTPPYQQKSNEGGGNYSSCGGGEFAFPPKDVFRNPGDRQGIPELTPVMDNLFARFLACPEAWDGVMEGLNAVEQGRGQEVVKGFLQKDERTKTIETSETTANEVVTSTSTLSCGEDTQASKAHPETITPKSKPQQQLVQKQQQISSSTRKRSGDKSRLVKDVPRFYWPEGKPPPSSIIQDSLSKAEEKFKQFENTISFNKIGELLVTVGLPLYWKRPFWMALNLTPDATCTSKIFLPFLRYLLSECPDDASRFLRIVSSGAKNFPEGAVGIGINNNRNSKYYGNHGDFCVDLKNVELSMSDFIPMVQDIIDTHPGLGFLRDAPEFHSRYVTTVISRIFYKVNRSWSGKLTLTDLTRSNLLRVIKRLEEETDINSITEYFSYEHFYVIYCKFWELDKDHDLLIDKHDLASHSEHALSSRIIERIFGGTVLRGWDVTSSNRASKDKMTYSDFVWFLLSEEDKKTPTAIEYWFRCLDLDGDGVLSPYELQYFYSEQESRIESLGIEPLHFSNVYCQIVDMLHCSPTGIRLRDLKRNSYLAAIVFNTLFNLDKYLEHEQRDPFAAASSLVTMDGSDAESDWDKFAASEYELLIAEESPADQLHDSGMEEALTP